MDKLLSLILGLYAAFLSAALGITGLIEIASGLGLISEVSWMPADVFGGFCLLVMGTVYLKGIIPIFSAKQEGLSYLLVGTLLLAAVGGLYYTILVADWFGENIVAGFEPVEEEELADVGEEIEAEEAEEEEPWNPLDDVRLEMILTLIALPALLPITYRKQLVNQIA